MKKYERVKIRCVDTGEIFENLTEAAKAIGCGKSALSNHLSGRYPHVRGKKYERL
jgi:hypothetical protein